MIDGWLKREFERARERSSKVPFYARPVVVRGSMATPKRDHVTPDSYTVEEMVYCGSLCPLCGQRVVLVMFLETWKSLDGDAERRRVRISVPGVHTCVERPDGTFAIGGEAEVIP